MISKKCSGIIVVLIIIIFGLSWHLLSPSFVKEEVNKEPQIINEEETAQTEEEYEGYFIGTDFSHKASGKAIIIRDSEDTTYVRFEDFEVTGGPDLRVYLSRNLEATDYVDLGKLKGNIGSQNYVIPSRVKFEEYEYILIWSKESKELYGYAKIA